MKIKEIPAWLVAWLLVSLIALGVCFIPSIRVPQWFIPAGVFTSGVVASFLFAVLSEK
jgi:hypothetical protein